MELVITFDLHWGQFFKWKGPSIMLSEIISILFGINPLETMKKPRVSFALNEVYVLYGPETEWFPF